MILIVVKQVRLEKVKLSSNGWKLLSSQLSQERKNLNHLKILHLTECWPPEEIIDKIRNLEHFSLDYEQDLFSLNNNNLILTRRDE